MRCLTALKSSASSPRFAAVLLAACCLYGSIVPALCSPLSMKGPPRSASIPSSDHLQESSVVRLAMLEAIHFYRSVISPTQGGRCGFYPSCSTFGMHAVQHYGPLQGVMMTADRLTRCNLLKGPGPDYYPLPNGKLFDPVSRNLLVEP